MEEYEFRFFEYFQSIWKRRSLILLGALACAIVAIVFGFLMKSVYSIDAIIQPAKMLIENESKSITEFVVEDPQQLADKINHNSYNVLIAKDMGIVEIELPIIKGERIKNTLLVRMWIRDHDVERSQAILKTLINYLKAEMDKKIAIERSNIDSIIDKNKIDRERRKREIDILKNKLKIIQQRKQEIVKERGSARQKITELEGEQQKVLKEGRLGETESLAMLLYSNEIQQSLRYVDELNENLSDKRLEEESTNSNMESENSAILQIENEIANLTEQKGRMDVTQIIKSPAASHRPISPNIKLNAAVAFFLGLLMLSGLAVFLEYLKKQRG